MSNSRRNLFIPNSSEVGLVRQCVQVSRSILYESAQIRVSVCVNQLQHEHRGTLSASHVLAMVLIEGVPSKTTTLSAR